MNLKRMSEEIANTEVITVRRRLKHKKMTNLRPDEEEEMYAEYGRPISEIYACLIENATHITRGGPIGLEMRIHQCTRFYRCVSENLKAINDYLPTMLTKVYNRIDDLLEECDYEIENVALLDIYSECRLGMTLLICEQIKFIKNVQEKMNQFFLNNPFRVLQMATPKFLTVENCLTPAFLPYVLGEMALPNWVVPQSMRILNGARKIIQTREYVERKGVEMHQLLMKSNRMRQLSECIVSQIALYAVDVSQIVFDLFPVVTEEMLLKRPEIHFCRELNLTSRVPRVILTI